MHSTDFSETVTKTYHHRFQAGDTIRVGPLGRISKIVGVFRCGIDDTWGRATHYGELAYLYEAPFTWDLVSVVDASAQLHVEAKFKPGDVIRGQYEWQFRNDDSKIFTHMITKIRPYGGKLDIETPIYEYESGGYDRVDKIDNGAWVLVDLAEERTLHQVVREVGSKMVAADVLRELGLDPDMTLRELKDHLA